MATKYKIGDEVVLTSVESWEKEQGLRVGMKGKIVKLLGLGWADVSFKGWHNGHTNKQLSIWIVGLEK